VTADVDTYRHEERAYRAKRTRWRVRVNRRVPLYFSRGIKEEDRSPNGRPAIFSRGVLPPSVADDRASAVPEGGFYDYAETAQLIEHRRHFLSDSRVSGCERRIREAAVFPFRFRFAIARSRLASARACGCVPL